LREEGSRGTKGILVKKNDFINAKRNVQKQFEKMNSRRDGEGERKGFKTKCFECQCPQLYVGRSHN